MEEIKLRYRFREMETNKIITRIFSIRDLEISRCILFDFLQYEILSRDLYTGLKDRDGREIYENDIIKRTMPWGCIFSGQVVWDNDYARFQLEDNFHAKHNIENVSKSIKDESIGNVHDNPNLLESCLKEEIDAGKSTSNAEGKGSMAEGSKEGT